MAEEFKRSTPFDFRSLHGARDSKERTLYSLYANAVTARNTSLIAHDSKVIIAHQAMMAYSVVASHAKIDEGFSKLSRQFAYEVQQVSTNLDEIKNIGIEISNEIHEINLLIRESNNISRQNNKILNDLIEINSYGFEKLIELGESSLQFQDEILSTVKEHLSLAAKPEFRKFTELYEKQFSRFQAGVKKLNEKNSDYARDFKEARDGFKKVIKNHGGEYEPLPWFHYGWLSWKLGEKDGISIAVEAFDSCRHYLDGDTKNPLYVLSLRHLAHMRYLQENYEEAYRLQKEVISLLKTSETLLELARYAAKCGRIEESIEYLDKSITINPHIYTEMFGEIDFNPHIEQLRILAERRWNECASHYVLIYNRLTNLFSSIANLKIIFEEFSKITEVEIDAITNNSISKYKNIPTIPADNMPYQELLLVCNNLNAAIAVTEKSINHQKDKMIEIFKEYSEKNLLQVQTLREHNSVLETRIQDIESARPDIYAYDSHSEKIETILLKIKSTEITTNDLLFIGKIFKDPCFSKFHPDIINEFKKGPSSWHYSLKKLDDNRMENLYTALFTSFVLPGALLAMLFIFLCVLNFCTLINNYFNYENPRKYYWEILRPATTIAILVFLIIFIIAMIIASIYHIKGKNTEIKQITTQRSRLINNIRSIIRRNEEEIYEYENHRITLIDSIKIENLVNNDHINVINSNIIDAKNLINKAMGFTMLR